MKTYWICFCLLASSLSCFRQDVKASVIINEILYDPSGSDTGFEFVELLNNGSEPSDLTGYELKLADSNYYTFGTFVLPAGQRVVIHNNLTGDDTLTDLFTGPLTNMGNTSNSVALFSGPHTTDNIIDFVQYGTGGQQWQSAAVTAGIWTEDDFVPDAAEGLSVNLDPDGQDNNLSTDWLACDPTAHSINCESITPTATPVTPTATPPPPTSTPTRTPTPTSTPTTPFTSTPTSGPTSTPTSGPTSTPTSGPTSTPSPPPTPTPSSPPTVTPTAEPTGTPEAAAVLINEVLYDPDGVDTGLEWVELINVSSDAVPLQSWVLKPDDADYFVFPDYLLEPGARVLIHVNAEGTPSGSELYAGLSQNMGNTSGSVVLFSGTPYSVDTIVDFVQYGAGGQTWESLAVSAGIWTDGDFTVDVDEGFSLSRFPDAVDYNLSSDWIQCLATFLTENCVIPTPTLTPEVTPTNTPDTPTPPTSTPTSSPVTQTPTSTPTSVPAPGVTINEVFYNPDGNDTGLEFIELINTSGDPVDLTGFDLKPDSSAYFTFPAFVLQAGTRVVVRINTSGENTSEELFTGPTSNMGNSAGFVALFNSSTHGSSTIVDYVEFGAGGQTWESSAVEAGIWSSGDFVAVCDEGLSMNLDPDGVDTNQSADWSACDPSMLQPNCEIMPTPSPTPTFTTQTPTSTAEPTTTPEPREGVVINEVLFDPEGTDTGLEYIELYNNSPDPVILTGYDLKPDTSAYFTLPDFTLGPMAYVVVHINSSGTNTQTDLYTGPTSNMGNSGGFVALFDDISHSASTMVDYIAYGAAGQTWESAAVDAGIWTEGDFIPLVTPEGLSLNLCPNGHDIDAGRNWQLDLTSPGTTNNCAEPTPTPTETATPTATSVPTHTPTPRPTVEPVILLAGFADSDYRIQTGGTIRIIAWIIDPEDDITQVRVFLGGEPVADMHDDGKHGDFGAGDGVYGWELELPPAEGAPAGLLRLQLRIIASDSHGYESHAWPLFSVVAAPGATAAFADDSDPPSDTGKTSTGAPGTEPGIYAAGFMNSRVTTTGGGQLTILAVTTGPLPIMDVELYYQGLPTGVRLLDNGQQEDFGAGDGVFGLTIPILPGQLNPGDYPFQLRAKDINGNLSDLWPYLTISE